MKLWLKSCLVFTVTLLITLILSDLVFTYSFFNVGWEFYFYKWTIPCFVATLYLTFNICSNLKAFVVSIMSILTFYILELTYQYNFSGILIDYVAPVTLWQIKKDKLMILLKSDLQPLPWFLAGLLGYLCSIVYKFYRNKKDIERNIYV